MSELFEDVEITEENELYGLNPYVSWHPLNEEIILDGSFTVAQLELIVEHIKKYAIDTTQKENAK